MITFNKIDFSKLDWIIITNIEKPLTSGFNNSIKTLNGIDKSYDFGFSLQPKVYRIKGIIYAENGNNIYDLFEEFLSIIYTKEAKEFYINENPSKVYKGRLQDAPLLTKINLNAYEVEFAIVCSNPYATSNIVHRQERVSQTLDTFAANNRGVVECFPLFKVRNASVLSLDNFVTNGDFENLSTGWIFTKDEDAIGTFTLNASAPHSGDLCGCVTKTNQYTEQLSTKIAVSHTANHTYYGSAWINCEEAAGVEISVIETVVSGGTTSDTILTTLFSSDTTDSWQKVEFDFTPNYNDSLITLEFNFNSNETYTTYIDDVFISANPQVSIDYFGIEINGVKLEFSGALLNDDTIILDCEKWSAKLDNENNTNMLPYIDGGFPVLNRGANEVKITTNNNAAIRVILEYKERYL